MRIAGVERGLWERISGKKWKQSLHHLEKPLSEYILSHSPASLGQQGLSADNTVTNVVDNTNVSPPVSGHASVNQPVQVPPVTRARLSASISPASLIYGAGVPPSQPDQLRHSASGNPSNGVTGSKPLLVNTVLSFIVAYRLKGDSDSLKRVAVERFCNEDIEAAKGLLWDCCSSDITAKGLVFHSRRDSDKRSQFTANLDDILQALQVLDTSDSIPTICCEATQLHRIPPLSLDPVAEQVHCNSQALKALSSSIEGFEKKLSSFLSHGSSTPVATSAQPGLSYAAAASSPLPPVSRQPSVVSHRHPQRPSPADDRSCNVILFGLPENRSLFESKKVVDEMLEFLSGKPIQIKNMFRLGKYVPSTSSTSRPRPILIKLCTAWDCKLVLLHKTNLRNFHTKRLFLREDVSPDHRLRRGKSNASAETSPTGDSSVDSSGSAAKDSCNSGVVSAPQASSHPPVASASSTRNSLSPAESETSLLSVCPLPVHAASQPPSHSSSTSSSSTVVQGSSDDHHDSA